eukprot:8778731-Pyramimonas_sp.AAC.1
MTKGTDHDNVHKCKVSRPLWPGWALPAPVKGQGRPRLPGWFFPDDWDYVPVIFPYRDDVHDFATPSDTIHS